MKFEVLGFPLILDLLTNSLIRRRALINGKVSLSSTGSGAGHTWGVMMYRYDAAGSLENKPKVRDGECVALIQEYAGAGHSSTWRAGEKVIASRGLLAGTAIATFASGRFPKGSLRRHAAFFLRYGPRDQSGNATYFWVIEQYNHPPIKSIQARQIFVKSGLPGPSGGWPDASNNANAFHVIE